MYSATVWKANSRLEV